MGRGDLREEIFRDNGDREMMLATLAETVAGQASGRYPQASAIFRTPDTIGRDRRPRAS